MPYKRNKSGRLQAYDPRTGHYSHMSTFELLSKGMPEAPKTKSEKKAERRERKHQQLIERALHSKDKFLPEAFIAIERQFPNSVTNVNHNVYDKALGKRREIDISTKTAIIEVKGNGATKRSKQLLGQKQYAESIGKIHILYAPNISKATKFAYNKMGINIATDKYELIALIRRNQK